MKCSILAKSFMFVVLFSTSTCFAVPSRINFQGRLLDKDKNPKSGTFSMTFSIWDADTGGNQIWSGTQNDIQIANGMFAVQLGRISPLTESVFGGDERWLQIQVGSEILSPREKLVATPYAFKAAAAESVVDGAITDDQISDLANIAWSKIDKEGSSLTDLGTRNAGDLNSGTLLSGRLSGDYFNDVKVSSAIYANTADTANTATSATTASNLSGNINTTQINTGDLPNNVYATVIKTGNYLNDVQVSSSIYANKAGSAPGIPNNIQVFTSNGTWVKPADISTVYVQVWGAGGGGGTAGANSSRGGGGGGGYSAGLINVTGDVTVTVGVGGTPGNAGGDSSFAAAATITANGGEGCSSTTGGTGGGTSGGTINLTGGTGAFGRAADGFSGGAGGGSPMGGAGGGGGSGGNATNPSISGVDGTIPGGGGGGGSEPAGTGGTGANGLVIVMY